MQVVYRAALTGDLKEIKAIDDYLFFDDAYPAFTLRQLLDISDGLFKVALLDEKIVGYAVGNYNAESTVAWFLSFGVLPEYRGNGIGEGLIKYLIREVEAKGAQKSFLTVHPDNRSAYKIYEKIGFVPEETIADYYLDGTPRIVMSRITVGESI